MVVKISNNYISASINEIGAELTSLIGGTKEYIWEGNPEFWGKHSPVLFPVVGTLKNNSYTYQDKLYPMLRHGFARDKIFIIKEHLAGSVTFLLPHDFDSLKVYPFNFELEIKYTVNHKILEIEYSILNSGNSTMPFSIGAHPAFALPCNFDDYTLQFSSGQELVINKLENDLLSHQTISIPIQESHLPLHYDLFKDDALVIKNIEAKEITILENNNSYIKVSYPDFPDLGIWTKPGAPFVCIEPWHGYADSIDASGDIMNKEGIILLEAGKTFKTSFSIEIT